MEQAGARIGFLEEVTVDYYPAKGHWGPETYGET
jgi:hypothetical protein